MFPPTCATIALSVGPLGRVTGTGYKSVCWRHPFKGKWASRDEFATLRVSPAGRSGPDPQHPSPKAANVPPGQISTPVDQTSCLLPLLILILSHLASGPPARTLPLCRKHGSTSPSQVTTALSLLLLLPTVGLWQWDVYSCKEINLHCRRPWFNSWVGKICWRTERLATPVFLGFPCGSDSKESTCDAGDRGSIRGLGRSPGKGKGYPILYPGLGCKESDKTDQLSHTRSQPIYWWGRSTSFQRAKENPKPSIQSRD